jgi:hypothetical protein
MKALDMSMIMGACGGLIEGSVERHASQWLDRQVRADHRAYLLRPGTRGIDYLAVETGPRLVSDCGHPQRSRWMQVTSVLPQFQHGRLQVMNPIIAL